MMPTRLLSSRPGKPTRLARQLAAAGLLGGLFSMLAVPVNADTGAAAGIARVVADGNPTTADDLIFTLRLDSGETLSAIRLDDDDTQRNLLAQFVRSPTADGRLSLRLTPPMDFDRLIGTPATLRLHIDGPQGSRELALPLAIAPVSALTETLTLRQVIADGAGSWTPRLPLRAAGNARLLAIADDQGAWAHRLSEADDRLQAEGENHLALPVTDVALAIVRELTPGGQRLIQPVSLQAQSFASLTAELDLLPDVLPDMLPAGTSDTPPRFTVPGAWNLDAGALTLSGAPTSDLSATFLVERLDNGDLRLTARSLPALSALGYPAAPLRLSLERHGAGQSATQSLRLHGSAASATAAPAAQSSHSGQISYRILPATPAEGRAASAPGGNASNATNTASPASPTTSPTTSLSPVAPTDASAKAAAAAAAGTASGPSPAPRSSPATDKLAPLASRADPAPATSTPLKAARVMSGDITQYQYDALGNRTRVTDPLARSVSTTWDALNRPKTLTQPAPDGNSASPVTQFEYDARDQLTRLTDARNLATRYAIDGLGQTRQLTSPDTGLSQSGYDAAGNLTAYTDARGQVQTRSYDVANRLTTIVHTGATGSQLARVELSYD